MNSHEDMLRKKEAAFKEMNSILRRLTALDKTEADIKMCKAKAYWDDHRVAKATAQEREAIVEAKREELAEAQAALDSLNQGGSEEEDQLKAVTERMELLHEEISKAERELGMKTGKSLAVTRTLAGVKNDLNKQMGGKTELTGRIKTANKEVSCLCDVFRSHEQL